MSLFQQKSLKQTLTAIPVSHSEVEGSPLISSSWSACELFGFKILHRVIFLAQSCCLFQWPWQLLYICHLFQKLLYLETFLSVLFPTCRNTTTELIWDTSGGWGAVHSCPPFNRMRILLHLTETKCHKDSETFTYKFSVDSRTITNRMEKDLEKPYTSLCETGRTAQLPFLCSSSILSFPCPLIFSVHIIIALKLASLSLKAAGNTVWLQGATTGNKEDHNK